MTHPHMGPGTIVIDTCDQCNLIWLDPGEFLRVINAPGKDRGIGYNKTDGRIVYKKKKN